MLPDIESGGIALWSGSIASIPTDWALCDGTNGTPDLRNKFVVGAGDSYNPADAGGSATHNHPFTGDGHFHDAEVFEDVGGGHDFATRSSTESITGTTDNGSTLAPYYSIAYIMKL